MDDHWPVLEKQRSVRRVRGLQSCYELPAGTKVE